MYQSLLCDSSLYDILCKIDADLAAEYRKRGCSCGGKLHSARYPRKARGLPTQQEASYEKRHSFCCDQEHCRHRVTPPSVRFLGRKVYVGAVVVLVTVLRHGANPMRLAKLHELLGVGRRTVERWRQWWQHHFVRTAFWRSVRGRMRKPISEQTLPLSLLEAFEAEQEAQQRLIAVLRFLCPLTTSHQTL